MFNSTFSHEPERTQRSRPRLLLLCLTTVAILLSLTLVYTIAHALPDAPGWYDIFADSSQIDSATDVTQVVDSAGLGYDFTPIPENPLLTLESSDPWDAAGDPLKMIPGAVHPDVVYFPEGLDGYEFWMVFTPGPEEGSYPPGAPPPPDPNHDVDYWWERETVLRSHDGVNWVKTSGYTNPVLSPGAAGEWDSYWHADPDFVYVPDHGPTGEDWFLYWTGCGPDGCRNGVAVSEDGLNYTKIGPIMPSPTRCPTVIYDPDTGIFHMWYNWGSYEVGYATSTDGVNFTPYNPVNPGQWGYIVYRATPGTYDQGGVSHMDVIYHDGQYWMYYLGMPTSSYAGLVVGLATSPDGINWTQYPEPMLTPSETWSFWGGDTTAVQSLYRPAAVVVGDEIYLYYGGTDDYDAYPAHNYDIGLAISTGPEGHVELEQVLNPAEYAAQPNTVAWYHMNEGAYTPAYPGEYAPVDSTLAWYHLNEGSGTTAADSGGTVPDDGTLDGATWTGGVYTNGLSFDGDDRVVVADSSELNPQEGVTIEAWVNPSVEQSNNYIAVKMTSGTNDYAYGLKIDNGETGNHQLWAFVADSGGTLYWAKSVAEVPTGSWSHVAMTYEMDPSNPSQVKLYLNGSEVSYRQQDSIPAGTLIRTNTGPLTIGCIPVATPRFYQGLMDEVRLVGRALTAQEIAADGTMSQAWVYDSSGNDLHGIPAGDYESTSGMFSYGLGLYDGGYVTVPYTDVMNISDQVSIEAWVRPAAHKNNNYVTVKMSPGTTDYAYGLKLENQYVGTSEVGAFIQDSSGNMYFAYGGSVPLDVWSHVAMTYQMDPDGPTQIRLFLNGEEVDYRFGDPNEATDTIPAGTLVRSNTGPLNIGRIPVSTPLYFNGVMDELRILAQALSPAEIALDSGRSYRASGSLTSVLAEPPSGWTWSQFYVLDDQPPGTSIEYSILDGEGIPLMGPITSGSDLTTLGSAAIQFHAEWATTDPLTTPLLHEWGGIQEGPTDLTVASFTASPDTAQIIRSSTVVLLLIAGALIGLRRTRVKKSMAPDDASSTGERLPNTSSSRTSSTLEGPASRWDDGEYYVAAILPIAHPSLPADSSEIPGGDPKALADTYDTYAADVTLQLAGYAASEFTPDLALLDAMIASLEVTP